jgi:hypothetical protein
MTDNEMRLPKPGSVEYALHFAIDFLEVGGNGEGWTSAMVIEACKQALASNQSTLQATIAEAEQRIEVAVEENIRLEAALDEAKQLLVELRSYAASMENFCFIHGWKLNDELGLKLEAFLEPHSEQTQGDQP